MPPRMPGPAQPREAIVAMSHTRDGGEIAFNHHQGYIGPKPGWHTGLLIELLEGVTGAISHAAAQAARQHLCAV